jgi:tetratricopeptide (TPR) repeat protein
MELLITLGQAERRAGDPAYRETLLDAARLARRLGHVDALCRAALANYRGIWSATWRVDNERIGLLREALDASGVSDSTTRVHLLAHLSAELIWSDDFERRAALADEAVAMARRLGDGDALAQALFSRTLGTWGTNVGDRLGDFRELLTIAERLGDQLTSFWAWRYRGLAEVEIGDLEAAGFSQQTCETIAEDLGQPALRWAVAVSRVGRLLLRGRLQEAEETARRAFELGQSVGEPDARIHYGTHRFQLRFEQGRLGEVVDRLRQAAHDPGLPSTRSMFALACCELGLVDEASSVFGPLAVEVHRLVPSPWWATTTANTAAVCAFLEDRDQAQRLIDLLAPRADHLLGNTLWIGCGWHYLGLLTVTLERWNEAEGHFAAAAALHERVGAPTWLARTRLEWARMLLARRRPGDSGRARAMLGQALGTARDLGLANIERRTVALLQECP